MNAQRATLIVLMIFSTACGGGIDDKGKGLTPAPSNNTSNNTTGNDDNNVDPATCGDGALDPGELCDPGIASGEGACPTSCEASACTSASLTGMAEQCNARCQTSPVACADGDGCCPAGCDGGSDDDCSNVCGDGVVDGPEMCDGNCPTQCNDGDACTTDTLGGSAATCDAACSYTPTTACAGGDACCPAGCSNANDSDCAPMDLCGNGTIDAGETCDGSCPSQCNDGDACTTDRLSGSAATCSAQCNYAPVTSCQSGDGCCPFGCSFANDNDCACTPKTCGQIAGGQCGSFSDGCGGTITCDRCNAGTACTNGACVTENFIGDDCTDFPQCGSTQDAACITAATWPGGYCTQICNTSTCPSGSHCTDFDGTNELCMLDCTFDSDCEAGYECRDWDSDGQLECSAPGGTATGDGTLGDGCASDNDCEASLVCVTSGTDPNGVTTTYPGGICTQGCIPIFGGCPQGSACSLDSYCMPVCTADLQCRSGYFCSPAFSLDGNLLICAPS